MRVDRIGSSFEESLKAESRPRPESSPSQTSFAGELKSLLSKANDLQIQADEAMAKGAAEGTGRIHETMIQMEEADISTRLMLKVRHKALEAYNEVMHMQF
jgi:flagellar hook-basal body complex protein FliE